MEDLYARLGASSAKEDVHLAIKNLNKGIAPGAFCKVLPDILGGDAEWLNVMHADGAGTKSILAYLYWIETGDISVWENVAIDALVMNLDDLLCVGATDQFMVTSTLGRNKRLVPGEVIKAIIEGTESFCARMRDLGIGIYFAGGETADVGDVVKTILIDSNITCRFPARNLIEASRIEAGNRIVGLGSFGQTTYETAWNSGIASNGITLARHVLLHPDYGSRFPESIDSHLQEKGGYGGKFRLTDPILKNHRDLGQGLLSPTRSFAPLIHKIIKNGLGDSVTGIIHNTGGAHSKVKNFIGPVRVVKNLPEMPEIFQLIRKEAGLDLPEFLKVMNGGIRMEIYCKPGTEAQVKSMATDFGISVFDLGEVETSEQPEVKIQTSGQSWMY
jgi:phosphoribosylformylglycinamidine cyclo-ligase